MRRPATLGAAVLAEVSAASALLRAAALTGSGLQLVRPGRLPTSDGVAAVLRWTALGEGGVTRNN